MRERESEGVGAGWVEGGARLQCGIREWAGTSSSVGTWRRPTNLGLGVVEAGPSRTVRSPKRTVREAGCYNTTMTKLCSGQNEITVFSAKVSTLNPDFAATDYFI